MKVQSNLNHTSSIQIAVENYLKRQTQLDLLRFITCGSVDDGKSTLIGRMLYEAQLIFEDQVSTLQKDSKKKTVFRIMKSISPCWLMVWLQKESKV